ncbi:MAG: hypothetical protein C5B51_11445 [Terriglobia bacterium]|nr:MAG: hypothetical protein C5B51_11445 [Terriglobia bacterium]
MLWYKSWLETRWRFLIGFAVLICSACSIVFVYPQVAKLVPLASAIDAGSELGREIREGAAQASDYRSYIWSQWFGQGLPQLWLLFATLLGTGCLLSKSSGRAALFTLSLPVSRNRLAAVRAAAGLAEVLVLAFIPSLAIPLFSQAVGQSYGAGSALIYSVCLFVTGSIFFSLAFLFSTLFDDVWRPWLLSLAAAGSLRLLELAFHARAPYSIFGVMHGEDYFRSGELPWLGLFTGALISAAILYGAARSLARADF